MKCLKIGKAAGPDRIMNEMLMYGVDLGGDDVANDECGVEVSAVH